MRMEMRMELRVAVLFLIALQGCSLLPGRALPPPNPSLRLVVAQVTMEAPVTSPSDLYTFHEPPSPESQNTILAELIDEIEVKGQRILTEQLANQPGFTVVPFSDARRMLTNMGAGSTEVKHEQLRTLAVDAQADFVVSAHIVDYGLVRWQYWVPGLLLSMTTETLLAGAVSAWNPLIMAGVAGSEL